jgi:hypothetical protein
MEREREKGKDNEKEQENEEENEGRRNAISPLASYSSLIFVPYF